MTFKIKSENMLDSRKAYYKGEDFWIEQAKKGLCTKCNSDELDKDIRIPIDYLCGILDESGKYHPTTRKVPHERTTRDLHTVNLIVSTYKGSSSNAIHYYGRMEIPQPYYVNKEDQERSMSFFSDDSLLKCGPITITRPVSKDEIEVSNKSTYKRYEDFDEGDMTSGFNTAYEVIAEARRILSEYFEEGWMMKMDGRFTTRRIKLSDVKTVEELREIYAKNDMLDFDDLDGDTMMGFGSYVFAYNRKIAKYLWNKYIKQEKDLKVTDYIDIR